MKYFRLLCVFVLVLAVDGYWLQAAGPTNFSGTWTLDLKAPEATSLDTLLEAHGIPWLQRKVMDTMAMTQIITQTDKFITIRIMTKIGMETLTFTLNGINEVHDMGKTLGKVETRTFWEEGGKVMVCIAKFLNYGARKVEWTTRRYLVDKGEKMIVDHLLLLDDGRMLTGKRVLRKK
jgi:hypothetical protein